MMGRQNDYQHKLFINGFNLDKRIRKDHILRKISENCQHRLILYPDLRNKMSPEKRLKANEDIVASVSN